MAIMEYLGFNKISFDNTEMKQRAMIILQRDGARIREINELELIYILQN